MRISGYIYKVSLTRTRTETAECEVFVPDGCPSGQSVHNLFAAHADAFELWGPGVNTVRVDDLSRGANLMTVAPTPTDCEPF